MNGHNIPPLGVARANLVIRELAASEARLLEEHVDDGLDTDVYRLLAQTAIHELHRMTMELRRATDTITRQREERQRLQAENDRMRGELRRYTAHTAGGQAA